MVVKDLDIFDRVGHSTAHDEIIPMSIKKGKLSVQGEVSTFTGKLHIEFVKVISFAEQSPDLPFSLLPQPCDAAVCWGRRCDGRWGEYFLPRSCSTDFLLCFLQGYYDNPKICALYILQGTVEGKQFLSQKALPCWRAACCFSDHEIIALADPPLPKLFFSQQVPTECSCRMK